MRGWLVDLRGQVNDRGPLRRESGDNLDREPEFLDCHEAAPHAG